MQIVIIPTLISNNPKFETSPHGPKYQVSKANCALNSVRLYRETSSLLFVSFCLFVCFASCCFSEFSNFLKINVWSIYCEEPENHGS